MRTLSTWLLCGKVQTIKNLPAVRGTWVHPWMGKIPWRKEWLPTLCTERIPCTEEPGELQFIGWQRVGHNWATNTRLTFFWALHYFLGFPGGSDGKESACNEGDLGLIPGLGRSPAEGHGNHSSILAWRIPMDRGAWQATVHGIPELDMTERLSTTSLLSSVIDVG